MIKTDPYKFLEKPFNIWQNDWFLLTAGNFEEKHFNTMTVAWGSLGIMWNLPFAQVVVRPTRFTYKFTEKYKSFTLSRFDKKYRHALKLLGTKSGRDGDKILESGLKPAKAELIEAPSFKEADLVIECTKIYWDDFKPENFIDPSIEKNYPVKDYHRIYFGKIEGIFSKEKPVNSQHYR